ncbi:inorganic phosphate transporter [Gloeophyllum trabeum ATCC 11539]|uniref:Inorganic phosphate transporter n=1 Tax=Gloeophyllum trabeum (strain ATCC 11539 / FP-39264 / Madison 617) TaxID=670483 RepID=S7RHZ9_GLOTA|nr:inorganic phosphate transporter [Gloeophyllum trabeum ATCC 11539]EPQ53910.1 inorganic phosphate transporter [Gloeophyllum trabeum ATCC 11539]
MASNPAIQNLVVSLVVMQLARKVPFEDPQILTYVRIGYVVSQAIILGTYYYTSMKIKSKNDQTVLKYVEPPSPMAQGSGELKTTTVRDYDLGQTSQALRGALFSVAMMCFLHLYLKYTQPLFIQAIMGIKNLYDAKVVQIHVLGKPAEGDLKRPFKAAGGMFGAGEPATDNASIAEAEKKVNTKKDE